MNRFTARTTIFIATMAAGFVLPGYVHAQEMPAAVTPDDPDHLVVAEKRTDGIMNELKLEDAEKKARVKQHIVNFIVAIKNVHEAKPALPAEEKQTKLAAAKQALYAGIEAEKLTDEQQTAIKNGLSANRIRIEYNAFLDLIPQLTDAQKSHIKSELLGAADEAVVLNSGEEKLQLFMKRRGRINNYLSKEGYDLKQLSQERNARNQRQRSAATRPTN